MPGVKGHIGKINLNLLAGSFTAEEIDLQVSANGRLTSPIYIDRLIARLSLWDLLKGALGGTIRIERPDIVIQLQEKPSEGPRAPFGKNARKNRANDWNKKLRDLIPFRIDRFKLTDGQVFISGLKEKEVPIKLTDIELVAENVSNRKFLSPLPATVRTDARVMSSGRTHINITADLTASKPIFDVDAVLENLKLPEVNTLLRDYTGTNIKEGTLDMYIEAAAAQGQLKGYAKPIIDHAVIEPNGSRKTGQKAKGLLAKMAASLLKNRRHDRIATKLEFSGALDKPAMGLVAAVKHAVRNAYIKPFSLGLEETVGPTRVALEAKEREAAARRKERSRIRRFFVLFKESFLRWMADKAPRLGAALSYYTAFSIAPLLLLAIAIAGLAFGQEAAEGQIVQQLTGLVGPQAAQMIQEMIRAAHKPAAGTAATVIGILSLLLGSSGVMTEMKDALNRIWRVQAKTGLSGFVRTKLKAFGMVLVIGFLLLVSLTVSAALAGLGKYLEGILPAPESALHIINFAISFSVIALLFAVLFKFLPDADIRWRDVRVGAGVTTILFILGKYALGLYLGKGAVGSSYGAAGAILIVLAWVYYSAQILYLGAEFTKVYADKYGSGIRPEKEA